MRQNINTSLKQNINTILLKGIEWKSFPELHLSADNGKYKIEHKFDIDNNTEVENPDFIEISIIGSNVKTMQSVATEAVNTKDYKRQNITKITPNTTLTSQKITPNTTLTSQKITPNTTLTSQKITPNTTLTSQKLKEFITYFNNPDWFFVYSGFTKIESNAAKSTDKNNYEIQANNSTIINSSSKLYIYDITNFASTDLSKFYPAAFLNNEYFKKRKHEETTQNVNNSAVTQVTGGKRNPDRERIYKLPIHKRRTDNYYNYE